jgi:hypothetical protein
LELIALAELVTGWQDDEASPKKAARKRDCSGMSQNANMVSLAL